MMLELLRFFVMFPATQTMVFSNVMMDAKYPLATYVY